MKNKYTTKKKERLTKFYTLIRFFSLSCPEFSLLSLPRSVLIFIFAFVSTPMPVLMPTLIFYLKFSAILSFYHIFALISCPEYPNILLSLYFFVLISCPKSPVIFLSCHLSARVSYFRSSTILLSCYLLVLTAFAAFSSTCHTLSFIIKFQLFYYHFLCLINFFNLDLHLLKHSNNCY